jgi:hypothetical protein
VRRFRGLNDPCHPCLAKGLLSPLAPDRDLVAQVAEYVPRKLERGFDAFFCFRTHVASGAVAKLTLPVAHSNAFTS